MGNNVSQGYRKAQARRRERYRGKPEYVPPVRGGHHNTYKGEPKVGHATQEEAQAVADKMNTQSLPVHPIQVYRCKVCGQWHVGGGGGPKERA